MVGEVPEVMEKLRATHRIKCGDDTVSVYRSIETI
jgi:hypothetical protein